MSSKSKPRSFKLPFVFSNFAMTADGKIAFAGGKFIPFGSARDRAHMMRLRATADAIICGARTVEATGTILGTGGDKFQKQRLKNGLTEYPLRVIASGSGSIDPNANIFQKRFSPIVVLTTERISPTALKTLQAVAEEVKIFGKNEINFHAACCWLRKKWRIKRLLCEGGGELHGALMRAGLVKELHLTICPKIFGGRDAPTIFDGKGLAKLGLEKRFRLQSANLFGTELFTVFADLKRGHAG
jgi:2,5-diamino-6-(ribosylamino)-4(3H)-pyrimidinone 5'-phosphate reductase